MSRSIGADASASKLSQRGQLLLRLGLNHLKPKRPLSDLAQRDTEVVKEQKHHERSCSFQDEQGQG